jgi:26S proteasome regulatory subunit N10
MITIVIDRHLVSVPPGPHLLSDMLISSPILAGDRGEGIPEEAMGDGGAAGPSAGGSGAAGAGFEFGVDPSLDPELAMVRPPSKCLVIILTTIP